MRVGPAVRSRGQRAARKLVGLRRTPMLAMRRQEAFRIERSGASPERLHRLSDSRFGVRTCLFSLCVEGRRSKPSAIALFSRAIAERLGKRLSRDLPHRPCCCVAAALPASPVLSYG